MEHRALGKGLSALIPERKDAHNTDKVTLIKTAAVKANTWQPRTNFDDKKLAELIASIKDKGVIQPLLVRKREEGFELIAGERRLRAAQALSVAEIPAIVKEVDDREALVLALVENIQREELNPIEEAKGFKRLIDDFKLTQDEVAESVGMNRSTVANLLRLLKLPEEIKRSVYDGVLSMGHARALLSVEDPDQQKKIFHSALDKRLSVRELENLIKSRMDRSGRRSKIIASPQRDAHLLAVEEDLQKTLGTKVRIKAQKKRGTIVIEYYSLDDLDRILNRIKR